MLVFITTCSNHKIKIVLLLDSLAKAVSMLLLLVHKVLFSCENLPVFARRIYECMKTI